MAASCLTAARTALKAVHLVPGRWLLSQSSKSPIVWHRLRLHEAQTAPLSSSRTETKSPAGGPKTPEEEDEEDEGPEYIPRRKAKNPMTKIGYAWMVGLPTGIIGFILAKRQVDKNRLTQLKVRQRMKNSNEGDYEGSRYLHHNTPDVKVER